MIKLRLLFLSLIILSGINYTTVAQDSGVHLSVKTSGLTSSGTVDDLPFWFTSNQQGIFEQASKNYQLADFRIDKSFRTDVTKKWDYLYGGRLVYANETSSYHQFNEWYAGIKYKSFYLKAGAFTEETVYNGLSSTNGNIDWSNNARPMPRIRLATNEYIPLPFGKNSKFWRNVTFKAQYDEGFLNDDSRYVQNAHLHHKSLYLRKKVSKREHLTIGGDHYAMWGGTSPDYGKMPGFKSYFRSVFFLNGSNDAPEGDQTYFAGNHLGMFYLNYEKTYPTGNLTVYLDHPWDHVPAIVHNLFDNLIGIYYQNNKKSFISDILFETMYTADQGGVMHVRDPGDPTAYFEHYFEHGEYKSGLSYENRIIASPFFSPMVIVNGINYGTGNNRVALMHVALKGYLKENLSWKYFFSYARSAGTYGGQAYDAVVPGYFNMTRHKFSMYGEMNYHMRRIGLNVSLAAASDMGHWDHVYGAMLKLEKTISLSR